MELCMRSMYKDTIGRMYLWARDYARTSTILTNHCHFKSCINDLYALCFSESIRHVAYRRFVRWIWPPTRQIHQEDSASLCCLQNKKGVSV